jgi:phenylalanyl-tRNA synthetase beta chain
VTANRPDLLGHWGVALEVAPGGLGSLALPEFPGDARARLAARTTERAGSAGGVTVSIEDPEGCPRYMGAVIRDVAVGPSPVWLSNRLRAVGLQPINNVVDATNYVLYELNQPLHAFDLGALGGSAVVVRRARAGEHLRTLDGKDRVLDSELLVIADAERPTALAGVMGGEGSEVTERTRDLFIECAYFDPRRVRRAARGLGLDSDASYRFQRGIDLAGLPRALERVVDLILTLAGGALDGPAVDVNPAPPSRKSVGLRPERVGRLLGVTLSEEEIRGALEPIGFAVSHEVTGSLGVAVPTWRPDVEREVDLIEEVARRHGYDKFPDELRPFRPTWFTEEPYARVSARLRELLVGCGFLEAKTSPFAPQGEGDVRLLNPLSEREDHLRRDLLTGLLHRVEYNFARGRRDVSLFELGTAFAVSGAPAPLESVRLAAVWTGQRTPSHWSGGGDDFDFWDLSWIAAAVSRLAAEGAELRTDEPAAGSASGLEDPLVIVAPDGRAIGRAGRVPAASLDAPRWAGAVWGLEVEVFPAEPAPLAYRPLPVYPAVERDLALVVAIGTPAATVEAVIREAAPAWLESLSVFDVYEGESIPQGTRSLAWRLRFRSPERTLTDGEVDAALKRIISALQEKLHVATRGA